MRLWARTSSSVRAFPLSMSEKHGPCVLSTCACGVCVSTAKIRVGMLIQQVLLLCLRHKVQLESHFASILLAIGVLEGVGRALDSEVDILAAATPVILKSHLLSATVHDSPKATPSQ